MVKSIIGGVVLAAFVSPAMASDFWVEYNYSTHECSIVEKKTPNDATAQGGPSAAPPADAPSSGAPSGLPISSPPQGFAAPTNETPPVVVAGVPNNANTPSTTPPATTKNPTASTSPAGAPNEAATPSAPSDTSSADKKDDPFAPLAAAWAAKKAAAEAAGTANVTTIQIGTAMHNREEAEEEMQVMRKCGLKN